MTYSTTTAYFDYVGAARRITEPILKEKGKKKREKMW